MSGIFSATIFNNAVFNTGAAVAAATASPGAGGDIAEPRKRQRFLVEIEGELSEVFSVQEAIFLLDQVKKEKIEEVRKVAQQQAETAPSRRKEAIHIPRVEARKLPAKLEAHRQEINKELEIAYWLMFEQALISMREQEQDDEEELLLLL